MNSRIEKDSLGEIEVPADKYWGAVTQRSMEHFTIADEKMPGELISAIAMVKKAACLANEECGVLSGEKAKIIAEVCDEIIKGALESNFPLCLWQTGSGTQTNMNVNEVICNRGNEIAGRKLLSPNDDVNMSQSTNDVFPTAIHVAGVILLEDGVIAAAERLAKIFADMAEEYGKTVKLARTHLMDATPMTFGQELAGYSHILKSDIKIIEDSLVHLKKIPLGGTAVGTGLNAPAGYADLSAGYLSVITGRNFTVSENLFAAMSARSQAAAAHSALRTLAGDMLKIADDIRRYSSGPKAGYGELTIPAGEPGSSIMPGKINPTQCEALIMAATMVMGNDTAMGIAASRGDFQLNVNMPLIAHLLIRSAKLLTDSITSFTERCVIGMRANEAKMEKNAGQALTLATALNPLIGYSKAAQIAMRAAKEDITLREAAISSGYVSAEQFDELCDPKKMINNTER